MCGLFGVVHATAAIDLERARKSRDTLSHRGPDQAGEWCEAAGIYIGHRRLSIIDTTIAARQPMVEGQLNVTVNGEIYNYQDLRGELQAAGYTFRSNSDSEVVLHGYRHWGIATLLDRLEGMYAAVIHDGESRRLYAFRDRVGIKPLYYYHANDIFVWASELKAINHYLPSQLLSINPEAVIDFLTYRYIPAPKSLYRHVWKIPAASLLTYQLDSHEVSVARYWHLHDEEVDANEDELKAKLRETLQASITSQLVSDVPLGLLLSGGIDSAIIAKYAGACSPGLQGFSVGFNQAGRDETPLAQLMADDAGIALHTAQFPVDNMVNVAQRIRTLFDEPFGDTSAFPTHQVCQFAKRHVTVALSGDGGDELFGGYRWYERYDNLHKNLKRFPWRPRKGIHLSDKVPLSRSIALHSIGDPLWVYAVVRGSLHPARLAKWKHRLGVESTYDELWAYRQFWRPHLPAAKAAQVLDFHTYLPDDILTKVDRVSMAVSLECRPALLSTDTVEMAFSLPESFTFSARQLKGGLRQAFSAMLPDAIIHGPKQGFSVPDTGWRSDLVSQHGSVQEALLSAFLDNDSQVGL